VYELEVKLYVIIISSVGAIPDETRNDLRDLLKFKKMMTKDQKTIFDLCMKRLVMASLRGLILIWRDVKNFCEKRIEL
jgi:hypothetical protein